MTGLGWKGDLQAPRFGRPRCADSVLIDSGVDPGLWPDGGALDRQTAAAPSKVQFEIHDLWRVLGVGFGPHAD